MKFKFNYNEKDLDKTLSFKNKFHELTQGTFN